MQSLSRPSDLVTQERERDSVNVYVCNILLYSISLLPTRIMDGWKDAAGVKSVLSLLDFSAYEFWSFIPLNSSKCSFFHFIVVLPASCIMNLLGNKVFDK